MEPIQRLSKAQANVVMGLVQHYLSTGENPTEGYTLDEFLIELSKVDEAKTPPVQPIIDGVLEWLKPIVQSTPTMIDDMILKIVEGAGEVGAFPLIKAWIDRIKRRRQLKREAKESSK